MLSAYALGNFQFHAMGLSRFVVYPQPMVAVDLKCIPDYKADRDNPSCGPEVNVGRHPDASRILDVSLSSAPGPPMSVTMWRRYNGAIMGKQQWRGDHLHLHLQDVQQQLPRFLHFVCTGSVEDSHNKFILKIWKAIIIISHNKSKCITGAAVIGYLVAAGPADVKRQ